jgi:hypothetical protein
LRIGEQQELSTDTLFGVQVLFQNEALYAAAGGDRIAAMKAHVDAAASLGVDVIRFPGDWRAFEEQGQGQFSAWYVEEVTATLSYAKSLGISVVMTFAQTPHWATAQVADPSSMEAIWAPPAGEAAQAYAQALVAFHGEIEAAGLLDTIKAWEIWNEPNAMDFWSGSTLREGTDVQVALEHAADYAALLNAAYDALKAVDPSAVVLGGSLAGCDAEYLTALYAAGAKFDALALHPYTKANPFNGGVAYGPEQSDAADPLSQVWSFKDGIESIRAVMAAHGDIAKGLWFTEFGWSSSGEWGGSGSAAAQAQFLEHALQLIRGWDFVDAAIAYRLFDGSGEEFGMRAEDGTLKPSGQVLQDFLAALAATNGTPPPASTPVTPAPPSDALIVGTQKADHLTGTGNANTIMGEAGNDRLEGKAGNDTLAGGSGDNWLFGGEGNDRITGGADCDWIEGGAGGDTMTGGGYHGHLVYWSSRSGVQVNLSTGLAAGGDAQGDKFSGIIAVDGSEFRDVLTGNNGANWTIGLGGNDTLKGLGGADRVDGGAGNDLLSGGMGADTLIGGAGRDMFDFDSLADSGKTGATRDLILDFTRGSDRLDLSGMDANARASGNQAFSFLGSKAFTGKAGELHYLKACVGLVIEGDINGDKIADFQIAAQGLKLMGLADFVL